MIRVSRDEDRLIVKSDYSDKDRLKALGARWDPEIRCWTFPLRFERASALRREFRGESKWSRELIEWGRAERERRRGRADLALANTATLERLPELQPELNGYCAGRPFQLADIAMMAGGSCINANEPGLGKTPETIGAVIEAGMIGGRHLVIAPVTSLSGVWGKMLDEYGLGPWFTGQSPDERREAALRSIKTDSAHWLLLNPGFFQRGDDEIIDLLAKRTWSSVTIDEFQGTGLPSEKFTSDGKRSSKFARAMGKIKAERKWALSGTPMGGQPIKLWAILNWLDPKAYGSKWRWVEEWLEVDTSGYGGHPVIGGLKKGVTEEEFYKAHAHMIVRRTQAEEFKDMPEPMHIDVWCELTKKQRRAYDSFVYDAEVRVEGGNLTAIGILAEYTRAKQFANSLLSIKDGNVIPTDESGKIDTLVEKLAERGIAAKDWSGKKAIVASQFTKFLYVVKARLEKEGIKTLMISGETKESDRVTFVERFQTDSEHYVMLIATKAGGVSITLDRADSCHLLDETWNPDDQRQVWGRMRPMLQLGQVAIYIYRSMETIDEDIYDVVRGKEATNLGVLDLRRQGLRLQRASER
jgi:SNF2 family DNA or RNA helicase